MRARLTGALLCLAVVVLVLVLAPLLESLATRRTADLALERRLAVDRVTDLARAAIEDGDVTPLTRHVDRYHEVFGEGVLVVDTTGTVLAGAGDLSLDDAAVSRRVRDVGYSLPDLELDVVRPWSPSSTLVSTPVQLERDLASGAVVMQVDLRPARADVRREWALVLLPALALLAGLVLAVRWFTRWILRPVDELDRATVAIASGERPPEGVLTGPPELRRLARSFRAMADALAASVDEQRDLVANTSHQLRNPLAAVRLHVDLLTTTGVPSSTVEALQHDLDRLDTTVDRLLGMAEAEHRVAELRADRARNAAVATDRVRVEDLRDEVEQRWAALVGAGVTVSAEPGVEVAVPGDDAVEMLDTLVDNAVKYAGADARVELTLRAEGHDVVLLQVDDDGAGLDDDELHHVGTRFWRSSRHADHPGTGLGLALVDALARANGGTMRVGRSPRGGLQVALRLPRAAADVTLAAGEQR